MDDVAAIVGALQGALFGASFYEDTLTQRNAVSVRNHDTDNQVVLSREEFIDTLVLDSIRKNLTLSIAESADTTD